VVGPAQLEGVVVLEQVAGPAQLEGVADLEQVVGPAQLLDQVLEVAMLAALRASVS